MVSQSWPQRGRRHQAFTLGARSEARERLPLVEPSLDERRPLVRVGAVQHGQVTGIGTEIDPGGPPVEGIGAARTRRPVAAGAIDALELDLTRSFELGRVGIAWTLAFP